MPQRSAVPFRKRSCVHASNYAVDVVFSHTGNCPSVYRSTVERHWAIILLSATTGEIFSLKFTKYRLAAGLRPDPLGELKRSPRPLATIRGPTSKGRGREGRGGEGGARGREGKGEEREGRGQGGEGKGWEGEREGKGRGSEGKGRGRKWAGAPHDFFAPAKGAV